MVVFCPENSINSSIFGAKTRLIQLIPDFNRSRQKEDNMETISDIERNSKTENPTAIPSEPSAVMKNSYELFCLLDAEETETAYHQFQDLIKTIIEEMLTECSSTFISMCCQSRKKQCEELSLTDVTYVPKSFGIDAAPTILKIAIDTNDIVNIIKAVIYCLRNRGFKDEIRSYFYSEYKRNVDCAVSNTALLNPLLEELDTTLIQIHKQNYKTALMVKREGLSPAVKDWVENEKARMLEDMTADRKEISRLLERANIIRREAEQYDTECRRKAEQDAELYRKKKISEGLNF